MGPEWKQGWVLWRKWISSRACCDTEVTSGCVVLCFSMVKVMGKLQNSAVVMSAYSSPVNTYGQACATYTGTHTYSPSHTHTHRKPPLKLSSTAVVHVDHSGSSSHVWLLHITEWAPYPFWISKSLLGSIRDSASVPSHISDECVFGSWLNWLTGAVRAERSVLCEQGN